MALDEESTADANGAAANANANGADGLRVGPRKADGANTRLHASVNDERSSKL